MGRTHNLSKSGACVELAERLQLGAPLEVLFQSTQGSVEVGAHVVWAGESSSAGGGTLQGLVFTWLASDQKQALGDLLHTSETHVRHAGVRLASELAITCQRKDGVGPPLQGRTGDISRAGLMLLLPAALPVGTVLDITLQIAAERLTAEGTVVWVEPPQVRRPGEPARHGIRFTALGLFLAAMP